MQRLSALILFFYSMAAWSYYGIHSTEAILTFEGRIELVTSKKLKIESLSKKNSQQQEYVLEEIDEQIQHLMGTFSSESFVEETNDATASISEDYEIQFLRVERGEKKNHYLVHYRYKGTILVHRDFFGPNGSNQLAEIPIKLPQNPRTIYELTTRRIKVPVDEHHPKGKKEYADFNLCTDDHYNTEGDFFYFWDPDRINTRGREWVYPDCPLINDKVNVVRTRGQIERLQNSYQKYLEYDRLYGDAGKTLKIWVFLGYFDDVEDYTNANREDSVWDGYQYITRAIEDLGLKLVKVEEDRKFSKRKGFYGKGINTYLQYQLKGLSRDAVRKGERADERTMNIELNLLVSDTALGSEDDTFHHFFAEATENADIIVYDGHSGLGANTDLENVGAVLAPANKYQIMYFNGCSGYPYFRKMYFDAKEGGSQNLDLFLSGISTLQDSSGPNVMAFLSGFLQGKTLNTSWILQRIEEQNFESLGSYLTGVLGEEDNHWTKKDL